MNLKPSRGFTLVEMLVVITIIGILAVLTIPNITKAMNKAKESECKANMHSIQAALESYRTSEGQYPAYIAGGNSAAWMVFHQAAKDGDINANLEFLVDPLIDKGFLSTYPKNPFIDHEQGEVIAQATYFTADPANNRYLADPRFGDHADNVGNVMDDPRFWDDSRNPGEYNLQFYNSRGSGSGSKVDYMFGGFPKNGRSLEFYWPGEFFYRSIGDVDLQGSGIAFDAGSANIWQLRVGHYVSFIMGVYGADETKGFDIIRLTGQGNYFRDPNKNFPFDVPLALPEVMGGGDENNLPQFPYKNDQGEWIFGAPDGLEDGIIYVTTGSGYTRG